MRALRVALIVGLCIAVSGCALRPVRTCLDHALLCAGGVAATAGAVYVLRNNDDPATP